MPGTIRRLVLLALAVLTVSLGLAGNAGAQLTPPWCGTPVPDAAENLPDGTDPGDPPGSFPHIPYYAIACTLEQIEADGVDDRMSFEVIGSSALGRPMYGVVINQLTTPQQRIDWQRWRQWQRLALEDPIEAQERLEQWGDNVKIPVYIQAGIHGNEYEGVDTMMQIIENLATTPYGVDAEIDAILDNLVVVVNVVQNPDGRAAGTRANGNGFDLNRDFLTQSQSETKASVALMQEWLPSDMLDLHGYVTPMLIEATTKPHNPAIDYDLWLKWNQPRIDANEAALASEGFDITRPINDWCADGSIPVAGICDDGTDRFGPQWAESWDDWGPFYTPMYNQHVGLNGSTTEMCNQTDGDCGIPGDMIAETPGRLGSYEQQFLTVMSTFAFSVDNGHETLYDLTTRYVRGETDAPRPACCEPPFDIDNNWMEEFPEAFVIPVGAGQRSDAEAKRLVDWLLFNGIEVETLKQSASFGGQTFGRGSYVVWMDQPLRGLADTALSVGVDVSDRITILYAPPAAWSHGYLWGADIAVIPPEADFSANSNRISKTLTPKGGVEPGRAAAYALELDSATAVRALNQLIGSGMMAEMALDAFPAKTGGTLPAGTILFEASPATRAAVGAAGRNNGLLFRTVLSEDLPSTDPVDRVPRIAALTGAVNQDVWSLGNLGFPVDPVSTSGALNDPGMPNPLDNYDLVWNTGNWPSGTTARDRLTAFFANGGGYMGSGNNGAGNFLVNSGLVAGIDVETFGGNGRSGIVRWLNEGADSPITGAYPAEDTAIVDPPSWFSAVPASQSVDARYPLTDLFLAGLWPDPETSSAPGSPFVVHGLSDAGTARLVNFAMNPLYRADPEREWPMVGAGAYWVDQ